MDMTEIKFELKPVKTLPRSFELKPVETLPRSYRKGSKYDPIIDSFMSSGEDLAKIELEYGNSYYVNEQLKKRIELRNFEGSIDVGVINNEIYIEALEPFKKAKNNLKNVLMENININENDAKDIIGVIYSSSIKVSWEK